MTEFPQARVIQYRRLQRQTRAALWTTAMIIFLISTFLILA